ncbi:unnamed protein product, partial [Pylaiella littoralis]
MSLCLYVCLSAYLCVSLSLNARDRPDRVQKYCLIAGGVHCIPLCYTAVLHLGHPNMFEIVWLYVPWQFTCVCVLGVVVKLKTMPISAQCLPMSVLLTRPIGDPVHLLNVRIVPSHVRAADSS